MSARDFALKLHTQSGSNAYFVDICNNRPRDVFLPKHQHKTLSQESTNELLSAAAIIGGVAAAHTAHISRPWVDNFGKFVHEATNKHHYWFWTLRKQQVEQEINKIQQQIQNITLNSNFLGNFVQQARQQHLQSRIQQLSRELTEINKQLKNKQGSQQLQNNA